MAGFYSRHHKKILTIQPKQLLSSDNRNITVRKERFLQFNNKEELRDYLIEEEINKASRSQEKQFGLLKRLSIDLKEYCEPLDNIKEIQARRDILVHNKGIVNKQYLSMVDNNAYNYKIDDEVDISNLYLLSAISNIFIVARGIQETANKKHYSKFSLGS